MAAEYKMEFLETSAKTGHNIEEAVSTMIQKMRELPRPAGQLKDRGVAMGSPEEEEKR